MKRKRRSRFLIPVLFALSPIVNAQLPSVENAIFWEISGNGLPHSSFLLGSHHLFGASFADSLGNVLTKFSQSRTFISEVAFDSSDVFRLAQAVLMKDTTLSQLLAPEVHASLGSWLTELSTYSNLDSFERLSPAAVQLILVNMLHARLGLAQGKPMDIHFQHKAQKVGMKHLPLETIEKQLSLTVLRGSYRQQAEALTAFVRSRETAEDELLRLWWLYRRQNLDALLTLTSDMTPREREELLDVRNKAWIPAIDSSIQKDPAFIVVGALHLAGPNGLVAFLRSLGYHVTPISLY